MGIARIYSYKDSLDSRRRHAYSLIKRLAMTVDSYVNIVKPTIALAIYIGYIAEPNRIKDNR